MDLDSYDCLGTSGSKSLCAFGRTRRLPKEWDFILYKVNGEENPGDIFTKASLTHHRIETFQVGMILEGNPGMPRNPRAVGFGSHERENVVPLLRKALGERRANHS